jgi:hypothetical protein
MQYQNDFNRGERKVIMVLYIRNAAIATEQFMCILSMSHTWARASNLLLEILFFGFISIQ